MTGAVAGPFPRPLLRPKTHSFQAWSLLAPRFPSSQRTQLSSPNKCVQNRASSNTLSAHGLANLCELGQRRIIRLLASIHADLL